MRNDTKTTHYLDDPLWQKLAEFPLGEGFIQRLARENEWGVLFTRQVVAEYRRFLYLTQVAGHAVTPSKTIDEAWHLHLLYTRSYWEGLCGEVLGQPLHHEPGAGKPNEASDFAAQYQRTRASYQRIFGQAPPAPIWGTGDAPHQRVRGWVATSLGGAALVGASGGDLAVALACFGLVGVVIAAAARSSRSGNQGTGSGDSGGSSCGGFFIGSGCGSSDTGSSDGGGGDSGGDGGSGCGSSCGGGGCGG